MIEANKVRDTRWTSEYRLRTSPLPFTHGSACKETKNYKADYGKPTNFAGKIRR